jgi:hypothetical protein
MAAFPVKAIAISIDAKLIVLARATIRITTSRLVAAANHTAVTRYTALATEAESLRTTRRMTLTVYNNTIGLSLDAGYLVFSTFGNFPFARHDPARTVT